MIKYTFLLLIGSLFLLSCAPKNVVENTEQTTQSIATAMAEAAAVTIADADAPSDDILDELVPGSGVAIPGLIEDIKQETAFDMSVSNAPARLFFMSLVKDTDINMVVHPSVEGEISMDLKNVTVREVMDLTREVYGYEYRESPGGYIVMPARIQSKIFAVDYLNISRRGESIMAVNSGQVSDSKTTDDSRPGESSTTTTVNAAQSSSINTSTTSDFWGDLRQTLVSIIGAAAGRSVVVDRHAGLVIVRAMPGELRDVGIYLDNAQDSLQRQVILETKIIEVTLKDSFQSGIDWALLSTNGRALAATTGVLNGNNIILDDLIDIDFPEDIGVTNMFAVGADSSNFTGLLRLLSTQGDVQVLSSPKKGNIKIEQHPVESASRLWRLDIGTDFSDLSAGRRTWTESAVILSWRRTPKTTVSAGAHFAKRFGTRDMRYEGRLNHAFASGYSAHASMAGAPNTNFLANYSVGGGISWPAADTFGITSPLFLNIDARFDKYDKHNVLMVSPLVQFFALDSKLKLAVRWHHARNTLGAVTDGYSLRADLPATDRLRFFTGYADAPEVSEGSTEEVRTIFGGVSLDLLDDLTIHANLASEKRQNFDRNTFGLRFTFKY